MMKREVIVVAHRGLHSQAAENSLDSIQRVVEVNRRGVPLAVEFDIRTTADGIPVINHDPRFKGCVLAAYTYADLQRIHGRNAPLLLDDAVDLLRSANVALIDPEVKELRNLDRVVQSLRPLKGHNVMVSSFVAEAVTQVRDQTDFAVGLITGPRSHFFNGSALRTALDTGATALIANVRQLNPRLIDSVRELGLKIGVYTENNTRRLCKYQTTGELDFVITDYPEVLIPELTSRVAPTRMNVALDGWALALRNESPIAQ